MSVSHVLRWVTVPFAGHQGRAGAVTGAVIHRQFLAKC